MTVKCKYKDESDLLHTYEDDLHPLSRSKRAYETGNDVSPALHYTHFLNLLKFFNVDLNGKRILNLGCGHGTLDAKILSEFDCTITGIEYSPKRVFRCNEMMKIANIDPVRYNFLNQDIHLYLDNTDNKFDIIFAFEVIEHLLFQKEVMIGIKQHLVDGGMFIGSVPIQPNGAPKQHIQPFDTMKSVVDRLDVRIFPQNIIPLRSKECRAIMWNNG